MIWTVITIGWQRLFRNRVELAMTFVVPIAFFSIFALIFGGGMATTPKVKAVVVDEVRSEASAAVGRLIVRSPGLRIMHGEGVTLDRDAAQEMVRRGSVTIAIVLRGDGESIAADLLADTSDQVAPQVVSAMVNHVIATDRAARRAAAARPTTPPASITDNVLSQPADDAIADPPVQIVDVLRGGKSNPVVSMYAAGIAVMFLLFGASNGGGAMLEERDNQTLERLMATQLTMDQLLLGKWFYQTLIGALQIVVMFVWAQIVFGVDLLGHLDGFLVMTVVTSAAAAAFGLFLATLCKTRGQLNGLSVIVILTMSALGGSMVPRYVMSQSMRDAGLWTFNAWALDGFDKLFWRDLPVASLAPQLAILLASAMLFLVAARVLAIRWETQ